MPKMRHIRRIFYEKSIRTDDISNALFIFEFLEVLELQFIALISPF